MAEHIDWDSMFAKVKLEEDAGAETFTSICRGCFHSYVCAQFNEHRNSYNEKCHFYNDHFVPAADVVAVVRCRDCKWFDMRKMECQNDAVSTDNEGGASYSLNFYLDDYCSYGERRGDNA